MAKNRERNGILEVLSKKGKLSEQDIDRVRSIKRETGQNDWQILLQLGMISEEGIRDAQAHHFKLPVWQKKKKEDYPLLDGLPYNFLIRNKILPLRLSDGELDVAIAHPEDTPLLETLYHTARLKLNVMKLNLYVGSEKDIQQGLTELYGVEEEKEATKTAEDVEVAEDVEKLKDMASEAPVVRFVHSVITKATEIGASDIHVELFERNTRLRYRVDGILRDFPPPQKELYPAIISRIKIMSKLNIAEKRLPQDGRIKIPLAGKEIDIRVSLIPTIYGEGVVMRILDRSSVCLELDKLGFKEGILRKFRALAKKSEGMILVTGPTGSGKTTTLYSILQEIKSPELKIVTVEDPVEYSIEGISQMQTNPQINLTFASALRNILRHDPDVILIGEIRDRETAEIAIQAALTGHLVFSTLHTNNSAAAFTRLQDMGIERYLLASSIIGVLAQRLVRVLCPKCKQEHSIVVPTNKLIENINSAPPGTDKLDIPNRLYKSVGCEDCMQSGYHGRAAIGELLVVDDAIRDQVMAQKDSIAIMRLAVNKGMGTLWQDGLEKVNSGLTTLEELKRVIDTEDEYIE